MAAMKELITWERETRRVRNCNAGRGLPWGGHVGPEANRAKPFLGPKPPSSILQDETYTPNTRPSLRTVILFQADSGVKTILTV